MPTPKKIGDPLYRKAKASAYLGVSPRTFDRLRAKGIIPPGIHVTPDTVSWRLSTLDRVIAEAEKNAAA